MKTTNDYINNAIRSIYQMIVVIDDGDINCCVVDHNEELPKVSFKDSPDGKIGRFSELRRCFLRHIHPEDREMFRSFTDRKYFIHELEEHVHISMECRIRCSNRKYSWSEVSFCNTTEEDSTQGNNCLFLVRDIDERKTAELNKEAEERALLKSLQYKYDALFEENMIDEQTGCYNRKGMKYYSDMVIDEAREKGRFLFVCVADLNGLKHLNDTYGHAAGDEAIAAVSSELLRSAPKGSRIVRTGGDEFLLFAALDKDSREPYEMNDKIDEGLKAYNGSHSNPYEIGASYGWVLLPYRDGMTDLDEYVGMADAKMYEMRVERDKYRRD